MRYKMNNIIEFREVNARYDNIPALSNLTFSIAEYDIVALVGNNGSGKTSTVKIISNIFPYDSGTVLAFNIKVTSTYVSYKNRLGILIDPPLLVNDFSPEEYLKFVCKFQKVPLSLVSGRIKDLSDYFAIPSGNKKSIAELSSGDRMKVAISAALIHNPDVLVLDEPFIHLDPRTLVRLIDLLKSLKGNKTIFLTSHNLDLVVELCARVMIIENGSIVDQMVLSDPSTHKTIKANLFQRLSDNQIDISGFHWMDLGNTSNRNA
jgi:ABC-2 type transport system ATP-binding protein